MIRIAQISATLCLLTASSCMLVSCHGAPSSVTQDAGLQLLKTYNLVQPGGATGQLDAEYCNRTDLVYDVTMSATANWNSDSDSEAHSLFTLGRNMHDLKPNSVSVMIWSGNTLFARLTPFDMSDTAQTTTPKITVKSGQQYTIHVRWNRNTISLDCNGEHIGDGSMASDFVWPANRPYFVGYEDTNYSPWLGKIDSGELRVYQTRIDAQFANGRSAGYFVGPSTHKLVISYPRSDGSKVLAHLSLTDINGKSVIANAAPKTASASEAAFQILKLPYGWYKANVSLSDGQSQTTLTRSIVITPEITEREPASVSPFGIADEGMLQAEGRFNAAAVEAEMDRMSGMGMRWLRVWIPWSLIEPTRGVYHWTELDDLVARAAQHGLTIYPALVGGTTDWQSYKSVETPQWYLMSPNCYMPRNLKDWSDYLTQFAKHYHGKISAYQIWNEPDARNGFFPFQPSDYTKVVKAASDAIHGVDAHNIVGLGGFCAAYAPSLIHATSHTGQNNAWGLEEFYDQKPQDSYDVMDCHFYSIDQPGQSWDGHVAHVQALHESMQAHGDGKKPLWDSEVTFATGEPGKIGSGFAQVPLLSGEDQAARLIQLHVQSASVGIARTFWYSLRGYAGLINRDFSPLPSYAAHVELTQRLAGMQFQKTLALGGETRAYLFGNGKQKLVVAWMNKGTQTISTEELLSHSKNIKQIDMMGNTKPLTNSTSVTLTTTPIYIVSSDTSVRAATVQGESH